ncbi:hypothetical protein [Psychrobacter urativorans]|uniref:Uncharacterized protein n=1 Tax=Psychrobacter urativorans TaxID=45610 RepID=A0A0M5MNE2_9GAMM|nr:hypothetical protein [Psychrobacter urativorans]ALF59555.1 hypothetical protein AOC03_05400 [Psychrobacter urativorans]
MSSYSFSHQFYQHWTLAPEAVRAAIVQELTDINTLLQPDTAFDNFTFSEHDLDAHLDTLYNDHEIEQAAAKKLADEQAQQAAEQQRLEEEEEEEEEKEKAEEEAEKTKLINDQKAEKQITTAQQDKIEYNSIADTTADSKTNNSRNYGNVNSNKDKVISALKINSIPDTVKQGAAKPDAAINIPVNVPKLSQANEDLIHSLGMHIDDYLSEQMTQLSEDLKSWLREEITHQLSTHGQTTNNVDNKK